MIPKLNEYKERFQIKSDDAIKPGLDAIQDALLKLGNPQKSLKVIHVTGTNGKGSTIAFMESILKEHDVTTGVFSSPAIIDIHDQIRMASIPISECELNESFKTMKEAGLSGLLTDFELLTVAAFVTFERIAPDYVLLETGMGARFDSTNVVTPLVSVITSIALDHTDFLGSTLKEIAMQKAGIIKEGVPVVTGPLEDVALKVIRDAAKEKNSPLSVYGEQYVELDVANRKMKGAHQQRNAVVAVEALRLAGIMLNERAVQQGLENARLANRFEEISPGVFLDGAHNPAAARALKETIQTEFPNEKVDFVIGMIRGKDIKRTLDELIPVAASFTFLSFPHPLAATGEQLMENCNFSVKKVINSTSDTILIREDNSHKKIITGSLYLLAHILK